ncbi:MAG: hypothetical protein ACFB50_11945 [Rubrobacteraceae bacterium]
MFEIVLALILLAGIVGLVLLPFFAPDALVLFLAPLIPLTLILAFIIHQRMKGFSYRRWRITPERITGHTPRTLSLEGSSPEELSRSIVERAAEIRRAMQTSEGNAPEIQVEMCALGYRACVNDMITLTHLLSEELPNARFLRRARLRRARRRATDALSAARQTLPPGALRTTRQEQQ